MKEKFLEILERELESAKFYKGREQYEVADQCRTRAIAELDTVHLLGIITNEEYSKLFDKIERETFC